MHCSTVLLNADDVAYVGSTLWEYYKIDGLNINMTKSEYMSVANNNREGFQLQQQKGLHKYKFL